MSTDTGAATRFPRMRSERASRDKRYIAVGQRLNDNTWDLDVYMPYVQNVGGRWKDLSGESGVWPSCMKK
jgi:hypothetical protein